MRLAQNVCRASLAQTAPEDTAAYLASDLGQNELIDNNAGLPHEAKGLPLGLGHLRVTGHTAEQLRSEAKGTLDKGFICRLGDSVHQIDHPEASAPEGPKWSTICFSEHPSSH